MLLVKMVRIDTQNIQKKYVVNEIHQFVMDDLGNQYVFCSFEDTYIDGRDIEFFDNNVQSHPLIYADPQRQRDFVDFAEFHKRIKNE